MKHGCIQKTKYNDFKLNNYILKLFNLIFPNFDSNYFL